MNNAARVVGQLDQQPTFDVMYWLKRQGLIGQLTHTNDLPPDNVLGRHSPKVPGINPPIYGLMVPVTTAVEELRNNVTEHQLKKFCDDNDIFIGNWISKDRAADEFQTFKKKVLKRREKEPMDSVNEILQLAERLDVSDGNLTGNLIEGSSGSVTIIDGKYDYIFFFDSQKHFTYGKKALGEFMELVSYTEMMKDKTFSGNFQMSLLPSEDQAEIIRRYAGMRKSRS